jgi:hypothetical protein
MTNLSKIKPQLRTTGNITGNFGRPKTKVGANHDIGYGEPGSLPTKLQFTMRLISALPYLQGRAKQSVLQQVKQNVATLNLSPTLYTKYL